MQPIALAPSLFTILQANARLFPSEPAVLTGSGTISYRELCLHADRVTRRIHALGVPSGSRVAIHGASAYMSRLAQIALSRLGMVAVVTHQLDLVNPDAVMTGKAGTAGRFREIVIDETWINGPADKLPPFVEPAHPADATCAIVLSSGTTGTPKLAPFSYETIHERIRATAVAYRMSSTTRLTVLTGMSTIGGLIVPLSCWAMGGTLILSAAPTGQPIRHLRYRPNIMFVSTSQLGEIVRDATPDRVPLVPPTIYVAGSTLPRALNVNARLRLGGLLMMVYGSTEVGTATLAPAAHTDMQKNLTGYVMPGVRIEIVDPQGVPQPDGTVGEVRIRTAGLCKEYLDDPQASALAFRDGWFHPGDLGVLGPNGDLSIVGRVNELMNFNGLKLSPQAVEEALGAIDGVTELAVFAIDALLGQRPCIAVVAGAQTWTDAGLLARFQKTFPQLPAPRVIKVSRLPRNEMGKVMRADLAKEAAAMEPGPAPTVH